MVTNERRAARNINLIEVKPLNYTCGDIDAHDMKSMKTDETWLKILCERLNIACSRGMMDGASLECYAACLGWRSLWQRSNKPDSSS